MKKSYPWLTLGLGLLFTLVLMQFGPSNSQGFKLPLLTALLMNELGLIFAIVGVVISFNDIRAQRDRQRNVALLIGNLFLAVNFLRLHFVLWPG